MEFKPGIKSFVTRGRCCSCKSVPAPRASSSSQRTVSTSALPNAPDRPITCATYERILRYPDGIRVLRYPCVPEEREEESSSSLVELDIIGLRGAGDSPNRSSLQGYNNSAMVVEVRRRQRALAALRVLSSMAI